MGWGEPHRPNPTRVIREWEIGEPGAPIDPNSRYAVAERARIAERVQIIDDPPARPPRVWRRRHNERRRLEWFRTLRARRS